MIAVTTNMNTNSKSNQERSVWYSLFEYYANDNSFISDSSVLPMSLKYYHTPCIVSLQMLVTIFEDCVEFNLLEQERK